MKRTYLLLLISTATWISCSKNNKEDLHPVDPPMVNGFNGKWSLYKNAVTSNPIDTFILTDSSFVMIKSGTDTLDKGKIEYGYGESINGFGKKQGYDSIVFYSNSIAEVSLYPKVIFFRQFTYDTISFGNYFKDASLAKDTSVYVRVKQPD